MFPYFRVVHISHIFLVFVHILLVICPPSNIKPNFYLFTTFPPPSYFLLTMTILHAVCKPQRKIPIWPFGSCGKREKKSWTFDMRTSPCEKCKHLGDNDQNQIRRSNSLEENLILVQYNLRRRTTKKLVK